MSCILEENLCKHQLSPRLATNRIYPKRIDKPLSSCPDPTLRASGTNILSPTNVHEATTVHPALMEALGASTQGETPVTRGNTKRGGNTLAVAEGDTQAWDSFCGCLVLAAAVSGLHPPSSATPPALHFLLPSPDCRGHRGVTISPHKEGGSLSHRSSRNI